MPVDRTPQTRYYSGKEQQQRSAREKLKFILANKKHLLNVKGGENKYSAAINFNNMKELFTDNQLSFIDGIYESTMKGAGFESVSVHHDKRKTLRY
jgi:hypothetical protein